MDFCVLETCLVLLRAIISRVFQLLVVELLIVFVFVCVCVFIIIRRDAPLGFLLQS